MSILTRYILKAHVGPFLFALGILTGLLLVNTVARRFEELAGKGLEFRVILEVFFLSLPHIIALTLPMAVLVAVLYTFSQLAADNEINALKSSGVNLVRLLMPLLAASVVLAVFMIWFNDRVLPETNHRLKNLLVDIGRQTPMMELQEQVVNEITTTSNMDGRYYLYATKIDAATNRLWDVIIYDMSTPGRTRTVYADSGRMSFTPDRTDLYMILYSGHIHELETTRFETLHRLYFDEQRLRIAGVGTQFERTVEEGFRSDREMSAAMLAAEVRDARGQVEQVRKETADHLEAALRRSLSWRGTTLPVGGSASNVLDRAEAAVLEMESGRADSGMLRSADVMARQ
ncbi:MAG TPA: LptF/LptG family permease, partial [Longimicrobiales bacterium]|nr:LptF/LptG family permease [Longimicrobiales bacterium]